MVKKTESAEEKKKNDEHLKSKIELAEIKQNYWKLYRDEKGRLVEVDKKVVEEERIKKKVRKKKKEVDIRRREEAEKDDASFLKEVEEMEKTREKRKATAFLEDCWKLVEACMEDDEKNGGLLEDRTDRKTNEPPANREYIPLNSTPQKRRLEVDAEDEVEEEKLTPRRKMRISRKLTERKATQKDVLQTNLGGKSDDVEGKKIFKS